MERKLRISGCDDSTQIKMEMTDEQFAFLQTLSVKVNKISEKSQCKPSMYCEGDEQFYWREED